jgi:hypothetical protein
LGRAKLGEQRALVDVPIQKGAPYFTILTPEFNHNAVPPPPWVAPGLAGTAPASCPAASVGCRWFPLWTRPHQTMPRGPTCCVLLVLGMFPVYMATFPGVGKTC